MMIGRRITGRAFFQVFVERELNTNMDLKMSETFGTNAFKVQTYSSLGLFPEGKPTYQTPHRWNDATIQGIESFGVVDLSGGMERISVVFMIVLRHHSGTYGPKWCSRCVRDGAGSD